MGTGKTLIPSFLVIVLRCCRFAIPIAQALLRAIFAMRTVLLVGFGAGLDDPNFGPLI